MMDLRHIAIWPLRLVGLDPGRSLINAVPTEAERDAQRAELWGYVQQRFGSENTRVPTLRHARASG